MGSDKKVGGGMVNGDAPLRGVRVLDLVDSPAGLAGRFLADLGADVVRVEPPGGSALRTAGLVSAGLASPAVSPHFLAVNANKRGVVVDLADPAGRRDFRELVAGADILLESTGEVGDVTGVNPTLVHVSMTDFGRSGPLRDWRGTDDVHLAIGGVLSRSGLPDRPPLLPPEFLAYTSAAIQAAWVALLAYYHRQATGRGDMVHFAVLDAVAQVLDPAFGIGGSARGGLPAADLSRGRPDARHMYPIFRCADGWARICVLSAQQWQGMFRWLGEPAEFADLAYRMTARRFAAAGRLYPLIEALFATKTRDEIVAEGQVFGVPSAGLLSPTEVLAHKHFAARGAFVDAEVAPGVSGRLPTGLVEVDGQLAGFRRRAPLPGEHDAEVRAEWSAARLGVGERPATPRPFTGLRVLDLGVIVVGAELGRLFADHGADVIKIESRDFPDGSRQGGDPISPSFAWGHRNKRSLGINLRSPRGRELFLRLVERSDLVLSNFKPGTMDKLGLGYADLAAVNPSIIVSDSSAFGASGPWSGRMGYGPLVRASVGLSGAWCYPGDDDGFSDAFTVYPDHVAARVSAVALLAMLVRRHRAGRGGTISASQAETILNQMADAFLAESLAPGSVPAYSSERGVDAPRGVFACVGDDEWCVVDVHGDRQFAALCHVIDRDDLAVDDRFTAADDRLRRADLLRTAVAEWTARHSPREAARRLQEAGVPAGYMQRVQEFADDPQFAARRFLAHQSQPQFPNGWLPSYNGEAIFRRVPEPLLGRAPMQAEDTREIAGELLGLSTREIDTLIAEGIMEEYLARLPGGDA